MYSICTSQTAIIILSQHTLHLVHLLWSYNVAITSGCVTEALCLI